MWSTREGQPPIYPLKADFFRVLGHPARVRMLQLLRKDERSVGALRDALGLDASSTSQHLDAFGIRIPGCPPAPQAIAEHILAALEARA
jgi:DNA-binding transcriptional ArsR family regulator